MPAFLRSGAALLCCLASLSVCTEASAQAGTPTEQPDGADRSGTRDTAARWRGFSLGAGAPALLLRERQRESFQERQNFKAAYAHPLRGRVGLSAAYEEYRFAVDRSALAERLGGSLTGVRGGASKIRAVSLTASLSGPEVAAVTPYVSAGPALVAYDDEPFRFAHTPHPSIAPVEHVRPGSSLVRPGGSAGAGVRVRLIGGLHGLAEGSFLAGFHPDGALLAALRAGVAYAY